GERFARRARSLAGGHRERIEVQLTNENAFGDRPLAMATHDVRLLAERSRIKGKALHESLGQRHRARALAKTVDIANLIAQSLELRHPAREMTQRCGEGFDAEGVAQPTSNVAAHADRIHKARVERDRHVELSRRIGES